MSKRGIEERYSEAIEAAVSEAKDGHYPTIIIHTPATKKARRVRIVCVCQFHDAERGIWYFDIGIERAIELHNAIIHRLAQD